jgi:cytochrome P450
MVPSPGRPVARVRGLAAVSPPSFDLSNPESALQAEAILAQLRRDDPVHFSPHLHAWFVTRHDDLLTALHDPRLSAAALTGQIDMLPPAERAQLSWLRDCITLWMGHTVQEDHVRLQKVFKRYFTPRTVESLRLGAQQILDKILAPLVGKGEMELVSELAYPFPAWVIADMLGVPPRDYTHFQRWSNHIMNVFRRAARFAHREHPSRAIVNASIGAT